MNDEELEKVYNHLKNENEKLAKDIQVMVNNYLNNYSIMWQVGDVGNVTVEYIHDMLYDLFNERNIFLNL